MKVLILDGHADSLVIGFALMQSDLLKVIGIHQRIDKAKEQLQQKTPDFIIIDPMFFQDQEIHKLFSSADSQTQFIVYSRENISFIRHFHYISKQNKKLQHSPCLQELLHYLEASVQKTLDPPKAAQFEQPPNPEPMKVMVVDDSALTRMVIESEIIKPHPQLELLCSAKNGQEALTQLKKYTPDVIFLDLEMPVMNGFEFLQKARPQTKAVIIVVSSIVEENKTKLQHLGADGFVDKPDGPVSLNLNEKRGQKLLDTLFELRPKYQSSQHKPWREIC